MSVEIGNREISGPKVKVNVSEAGDELQINGSVTDETTKAEMIEKLDSLQEGKAEKILLLTDHGVFIEGMWKISQSSHKIDESGRLVFKIVLRRK